jgi:hypothetical protein
MSNNLRGVHPGSISTNKKTLKEFLTKTEPSLVVSYMSLLTDRYFPELFTGDFILIYAGYYSGLPNNKTILNCDIPNLAEYIAAKYIPGTKIIFDNLHEGGVDIVLDQIHQVVKLLDIDPKQYYYLTGALNANELYESMCVRLNEPFKINIGVASVWDEAVKFSPVTVVPEYHVCVKSKLAVCFNRVIRLHRLVLACMLIDEGLLDRFYYSLFLNNAHGLDYWPYESMIHTFETQVENVEWFKRIVETCNKHKSIFPLRLNIDSTYNKNFLDNDDMIYFQDSYLSLVTETFFFDLNREENKLRNDDAIFLSEKTFKPIAMKHPFITVARPHTLAKLKSMGYKTFSPYINESYDDIDDDYTRLVMIVEEIKRLDRLTPDQWIQWQTNVKDIVDHNYLNFMNTQPTDNTKVYYAKN